MNLFVQFLSFSAVWMFICTVRSLFSPQNPPKTFLGHCRISWNVPIHHLSISHSLKEFCKAWFGIPSIPICAVGILFSFSFLIWIILYPFTVLPVLVNVRMHPIVFVLSTLLALLVHEAGHLLCALSLDIPVKSVGGYAFFYLLFFYVEIDHQNVMYRQLDLLLKLQIIAAGVWHNFALYLSTIVLSGVIFFLSLMGYPLPFISVVSQQIRFCSITIGLFSCLPLWTLDGYIFLSHLRKPHLLHVLSVVITLLLTIAVMRILTTNSVLL